MTAPFLCADAQGRGFVVADTYHARMLITWKIAPDIEGSESVDSAQAASELITDVILNVFHDHDGITRAHLMLNVASPLHEGLVGDGARAVERGEEWSAEVGPVRVTLEP